MPTIHRTTRSPADTEKLAAHIARMLRPGDIIGLDGQLGAGKTTFVRGLAVGLGIDPAAVSSPTFTLLQEYETPIGDILAHLDAYRMTGNDDLESIGWDELLDATDDTFIIVEWMQRIEIDTEALADRIIHIAIDHAGDDSQRKQDDNARSTRRLTFTIPDVHARRFAELQPRTRPCPSCNKQVAIDEDHFPFCTDRCRLIDLGEWFDEKYKMSRPVSSSDELMD